MKTDYIAKRHKESLLRKGKRVKTSGVGRTKSWGKYEGTIIKKRGKYVEVKWDGTSFGDEMLLEEVTLIK